MDIVGVVIEPDFGIILDGGQPEVPGNRVQQRFHIGCFTGAGFTDDKNRLAVFHRFFHKAGHILTLIIAGQFNIFAFRSLLTGQPVIKSRINP